MASAKRVEEIAASRIGWWRKRVRRLTLEELSDRTSALGERLSPATLSKIENGRRGLSLDRALLLAAALNVPFPLLILPLETGENVRLAPKLQAHADQARRWLVGEEPLRGPRLDEDSMEWHQAAETLRLWGKLHEAHEALERAQAKVSRIGVLARVRAGSEGEPVLPEDAAAIRKAREELAWRLKEYQDVRDEMANLQIRLPRRRPGWERIIRELIEEGS